ncbi:beta-barrel assembly-enhancing protease [Rubritalea halochordaticola]|uniref:Beta-barrel assembly-enhancing protease n=1 Tax=Rubritalea halochordaticola TaxID=714537 RepID=A0ABP9V046_9BACT
MKKFVFALFLLSSPSYAENFAEAIKGKKELSEEAYQILLKVEKENANDPAYWISRANHAYKQSSVVTLSTGKGEGGFQLTDPETGERKGTLKEGIDPQKADDAINSLIKARSLAPLRIDIHEGLATLGIRLKKYDSVVSACDTYLQQALTSKGNLTYADGTKLGDAWKSKPLQDEQSYAGQLNNIAKPESDKALEAIANLMVKHFPKNPMGHNNLALMASIKNDQKGVLKHLADAYAVAPTDPIVTLNYADFLLKDKQDEKAKTILQTFLKQEDIPATSKQQAEAILKKIK